MSLKAKEYKVFIARTLLIVLCVISLVLFLVSTSKAVTEEGFCSQYDNSPPNRILLSNVDTGIISNPDNYNIFSCCAHINYTGSNYYGVFFASVADADSANCSGPNGSGTNMFFAFNYGGTTIYCNLNTMVRYSDQVTPNYPYAEFNLNANRGISASNSIATDFLNMVIENNPSSGEQTSELNYSLPPGNLAIITTTASYESVKLSTTMPLQSTLFSGNPWPNTTQRIGTYNTLPASLNASTLGSVIEWQRTGDANLFGQTHSAEYQPSVISKFTYIVISNPYYYPANNMDDNQYTNGAISISMDDVVSIEIRNLTASINPTTGEVENTENGTTWTGEIDSESGDITWTDNDGGNTNPGGGGNLSDATISGFQSWLKGILTSIRDIFEPAHDAIQTLSSSVSNFAKWMYALYIWLPSPILNLLTSAISLAIVIGVIKVFI